MATNPEAPTIEDVLGTDGVANGVFNTLGFWAREYIDLRTEEQLRSLMICLTPANRLTVPIAIMDRPFVNFRAPEHPGGLCLGMRLDYRLRHERVSRLVLDNYFPTFDSLNGALDYDPEPELWVPTGELDENDEPILGMVDEEGTQQFVEKIHQLLTAVHGAAQSGNYLCIPVQSN